MAYLLLESNGVTPAQSVTLTVGETSDAILIKNTSQRTSIAIHPVVSGTGKAQISVSPRDSIIAGTANWFDWAQGEVAASTLDVAVGPITAVRGVCTAGDIILEVAAS